MAARWRASRPTWSSRAAPSLCVASSSARLASPTPAPASRCWPSSKASRCCCATARSSSRRSTRSSPTTRASISGFSTSCGRRPMSGHSKWSSIKHKKGAADAKRGKLFSKLARALIVASREGGPDPAANLALQNAIEKARSYSMPKENIERAIARGSGTDSDADTFEQVLYEGYGPSGVAVIVEALTDNRNRTAAEVRAAFSKHDGNLGGSGAVAWLFERRAVILVDAERTDEDELTLAAAEGGAEDVELDGSSYRVTAAPEVLSALREAVEQAGIEVDSAELTMVPKTTVSLEDEGAARKTLRLIDALEESDDVQEVYSNFDIPERVMEAVAT